MDYKDYDLLGVGMHATIKEIRDAYRKRAQTMHPDAGGDPVEFMRMRQAYERILIFAEQRPRASPSDESQPTRPAPSVTPPRRLSWIERKCRFIWSRIPWGKVGAIAIVVAYVILGNRYIAHPSTHELHGLESRATAQPCPQGGPSAATESSSFSAAGLDEMTGAPQRTYTVTGLVRNNGSTAIGIEQMGFYIGAYDDRRPPDWVLQPTQLDSEGNLTDIPPGQSVLFKASYTLDVSRNSGQEVSVATTYPSYGGAEPTAAWQWLDTDPYCQPQ